MEKGQHFKMSDKYLRLVAGDGSREFYRHAFVAHKVIPALLSTPFAAFYSWLAFQRAAGVTVLNVLKGLACVVLAYATVLIFTLAWYLITAPGRLHKKESDARRKAEAEVEGLRRENEEKNILEIVLENEQPYWTCSDLQRGPVDGRVGVKNISKSKTADDVCLSLIAIQNTYPNSEPMKRLCEFGATGKKISVPGGFNYHSHYQSVEQGVFSRSISIRYRREDWKSFVSCKRDPGAS
ncbi:MAG TPA: hypothetical protein VN578_09405 [Candidatus Binatia bacterium]|nr:hypothetical protein [Candidatus Binatia bacterium]